MVLSGRCVKFDFYLVIVLHINFIKKNEINLRFFHFHLIKELARKDTKRPDQSKSQVVAKQAVNEETPWLLKACQRNTFFFLELQLLVQISNFIKCSSMA